MNSESSPPSAGLNSDSGLPPSPPEHENSGFPRRKTGRIAALVGVLVLVFGGWYLSRGNRRPVVNPGDVESVEIVNTAEDARSPAVVVPPTAITAELSPEIIAAAEHPLDPLIRVARRGLREIDRNVRDYTAIMQKQVRVNGELTPEAFMKCKVRHARETEEGDVPFSVYTCFLKPDNLAGQEAIWVEGWNEGKLVGHPSGLLNIKRFYLKPTDPLAMQGNLHPITNFGMRRLIEIMVRKGIRDRDNGLCEVRIERGVMVDGHQCTLIEVTHPEPREGLDYHKSRIFIDDHRNLPIAYEGYLWPEKPGDDPPLLEKYYYTDIETNVGLSDEDFDPGNPEYNYRSW